MLIYYDANWSMDGFLFSFFFFCFLCYPYAIHLLLTLCSLYPYILSYHDIHTRNTIRKSTHLSPVYQSTVASQLFPKEG
jgi:hypothetical protein